jgi:excisionase family DNA binding protein
MSYTLTAAAKATGLKKAQILKAIEEGQIAGWKTERGEWRIEDAELHRICPRLASADAAEDEEGQQPDILDAEALGAQIEVLLRKAAHRLRQQLDDISSSGTELLGADEYDHATYKSEI